MNSFHSILGSLWRFLIIFYWVLPRESGAAYVQSFDCFDEIDASAKDLTLPPIQVGGVTALLDKHDGQTWLLLNMTWTIDKTSTCETFTSTNYTSTLQTLSLAGSEIFQGSLIENYCRQTPDSWPVEPYNMSTTSFVYQIYEPAILDSLSLSATMKGDHDLIRGYIKAPLTPEASPSLAVFGAVLPCALLLLTIAVALWQETDNLPRVEPIHNVNMVKRDSPSTHVTRVADYIGYIQFMFFSGALNLVYPGFFQPMASNTAWSTLIVPIGPVVRHGYYDGVRDGIYEVNGTLGGTPGLELMSQFMGAPTTKDIWTNAVTLAAIALVLLAIIVVLGHKLAWTRNWFSSRSSLIVLKGNSAGLGVMAWTVLVLFLSYLLLPLIAITTYQLSLTRVRQLTYTFIVICVVSLLILAIWWTLTRSNPKQLGYFIVSESTKEGETSAGPKTQNLHTLGIFLLQIVRGTMYGALWATGMEQLIALLCCDIVELVLSLFRFRSSVISQRSARLAVLRIATLCMMISFLPDVADHRQRLIIGCIIIWLQYLVLILMFLIPVLLQGFKLVHFHFISRPPSSRRVARQSPSQGLRLHDLQGLRGSGEGAVSSPGGDAGPSPAPFRNITPVEHHSSSGHTSPISARFESSPVPPRGYFRQPRAPSRQFASGSNHGEEQDSVSSRDSVTRSGSTLSQLRRSASAATEDSRPGSALSKLARVASAATEGSWRAYIPSRAGNAADYSVREADLYYGTPRVREFGKEEEAPKSSSWGKRWGV